MKDVLSLYYLEWQSSGEEYTASSFEVVGFGVVEYCQLRGKNFDLLQKLIFNTGIAIASKGHR